MRDARAKVCWLISKNMPEKGEIDQKQNKICLIISFSGKNEPNKIFLGFPHENHLQTLKIDSIVQPGG